MRYLWPAVVAVVAAAAFFLLRGCFDDKPTEIERRVDSTLATVPVWQDSVRIRDSVIAARAIDATRLKRERDRWQDSAEARLARADQAIAQADQLAEIPPGITPHDTIVRLSAALEAQKRATALLRTETIPALQATVAAGKAALSQADATIRIQQANLADAYDRIDRLTVNLSNLRAETRRKGELRILGVKLPPWTDDLLLAGAAAKIGYEIGRARS